MENERDQLEAVVSFLIKKWAEEEGGRATWQGNITHVPNGVNRYFGSLEDVNAFLVPYLLGLPVLRGLAVLCLSQ
jgi:hypothetical protein